MSHFDFLSEAKKLQLRIEIEDESSEKQVIFIDKNDITQATFIDSEKSLTLLYKSGRFSTIIFQDRNRVAYEMIKRDFG